MSNLKRSAGRTIRRLAALCLALTTLPILSDTASAQYFGGRGYGRGGGYYNRGYGGYYGGRGIYNRGYGGYYGGRGIYNRGYGGYYGGPVYSPFYGGVLPTPLGSPFVSPYVGGVYGGFK